MRVAIHETVDKADGVVFRCTLSGSAADRWLEVPAWMFDRARCLDPSRLTASPFASMDALSVLSDLLRQALKPPLSSSNAPHSGASRSSTTRIWERPMTMRSPVQPPAMLAERRRLQQSDRSQQIDLFDGVIRRRRRHGEPRSDCESCCAHHARARSYHERRADNS